MLTRIKRKIVIAAATTLLYASCTKDLDRKPFYSATSATVYNDFSNYKLILAKIYAGLAVSGQQGPAGKPDISGLDEGFSNYLRQYWTAQETSTDEAMMAWNEGDLPDYHKMNWSTSNTWVTAMYNRVFYEVGVCNEFIRETTDDKLKARGIKGSDLEQAKQFRAEARFMRALSYAHAIDMFGSVPFVTEKDAVGSFLPKQIARKDLFKYVEEELLSVEADLVDARKNEYGRVDKACVWTLLAKLYLNAEVYIGEKKYTEVLPWCNKIIAAGYSLEPDYRNLFNTGNNESKEFIFPICYDGLRTKTWGGVTFLIHAAVGGSMNPADFGINGGWWGIRTTKSFVNLFADVSGNTDKRALFYTNGQNIEINDQFTFTDGYAIQKFRNVSATGVAGTDPTGNYPDTDFPLFRLGDVYLMYAEAVLRGGTGGSETDALLYVNKLRERAYGNGTGDIAAHDLTLDFILNERGRELYWEGYRRTDLIRFGKYTGDNYVWAWKGGVKNGKGVEDYRVLFPLPASDIMANPTLVQNRGY